MTTSTCSWMERSWRHGPTGTALCGGKAWRNALQYRPSITSSSRTLRKRAMVVWFGAGEPSSSHMYRVSYRHASSSFRLEYVSFIAPNTTIPNRMRGAAAGFLPSREYVPLQLRIVHPLQYFRKQPHRRVLRDTDLHIHRQRQLLTPPDVSDIFFVLYFVSHISILQQQMRIGYPPILICCFGGVLQQPHCLPLVFRIRYYLLSRKACYPEMYVKH